MINEILSEVESAIANARTAAYYIQDIKDYNDDDELKDDFDIFNRGYKTGIYDGFEACMGIIEHFIDKYKADEE